ncbi:TonB-dependent receptor [Gammaproteobacteria bacterium]|nr:TonB-dependent receptor [Gammaproteobacteria bacterium]
MKNNNIQISKLAAAITAISFLQSGVMAFAQENNRPVLEEIVVTSQKREESLADVPLSITVVDNERIAAANINKIADLTEYVPNLTMTETGISTQMYIRGIGSGNNQAFEQSVGQYVDGIYYGRQQLIRAPFFDLERVEVLRGPQGTLFGKNTIAGALNLTTAKPTDERELEIIGLYEFESDQKELTAIASGPLADNFRARLAYRGYQEDGYLHNTLKNTDEPERDEDALRLTMDWDIQPGLNATLKIEHDSFETEGRQIEIVQDDPNLFPVGSTPIAGLNFTQILAGFGQPVMESDFDYDRQANADENSETDLNNITLNVDYELGDNVLTFVSGLIDYDFFERCDCDYTPASIFDVVLEEDFEQFSQEVRLSSPTGEAFEWVVGAYYQTTEMDSAESFNIPSDSLFGILAATSTNPSTQALAATLGTSAQRLNSQESDAWAIFAQASWDIADNLRLTAGGRYTEEDKEAIRRMDILDTATGAVTLNPVTPLVYLGAFDVYTAQALALPTPGGIIPLPGHNLSGSRSENSFTPLINLQWDVMDNTMLYASATQGFKAGGFDARANNPFSFEFEEEETTSFEFGSKSILADGAVELNVAIFFTDYDALQISQFDGTLGFNVGNAENTEVKGIEIDGRWAATDNLTVSYAFSHLDFEFTDFENGNCYNRQVPDGIVVNGVALCDYSGSTGQYTPENNLNLSFDYFRDLGNGIDFISNLSLNYIDDQNVHDTLDPNFTIDSVTKINLRVGLQTETWKVALIGKNLSDEDVLTYVGNVPLSAATFGTNTFYGFVDRPMQVALEAGYRF